MGVRTNEVPLCIAVDFGKAQWLPSEHVHGTIPLGVPLYRKKPSGVNDPSTTLI